MTNLSKAHQHLLGEAAQATDGAVAAPADRKAYSALVKKGLVISVPQAAGGSRLLITDDGRAAIGQERQSEPISADANVAPATVAPARVEPGGKIGALVALLRREEGATVAAMMTATGWQAHSVRGAMSGALKKKLGLMVISEKTEAGRVYQIIEGVRP